MAASSPGTYAKKYGKENDPKNIILVNDEVLINGEKHSAHQGGDKTLRANRGCSATRGSHTDRGSLQVELEHFPKPLEGKKKNVQFMGIGEYIEEDEKIDKATSGKPASTTKNSATTNNSRPTHIPSVPLKDTQQAEKPLPKEEQKVNQTDLPRKKKRRRAKKDGTG